MKVVKKTDTHTIFQKRSGRYAVRSADRKWITGEEKVALLLAEGLLKAAPAPKPEPEAVEDVAEESPASPEEVPAEAPDEAPAEAPAEAPQESPEEVPVTEPQEVPAEQPEPDKS